MPLTALTWRQLPVQTGTYTTPAAALNAINTAFSSATYANGSPRTPGSGLAWTPTLYQNAGTTEAVYLAPVGSTLNSYCAIAGAAVAQASATYATYSTAGNNMLYVGTGKNVTLGYAATWYANAGSPFLNGQFTGYNRMGLVTAALVSTSTLRCYESQDAIMVTLEYAGTIAWSCIAGAYLDPQSSNSSCAESDGKLYGCATGASNSTNPATAVGGFFGTYVAGADAGFSGVINNIIFLNGYPATVSGSNNIGHNFCFVPGASTLYLLQFVWGVYDLAVTSFKTRSNNFVRFPILCGRSSGGITGITRYSTNFVGRVRELFEIGCGAANGQKIQNGASDVGYIATYSSVATTNPCILMTV